MIKSVFIRGSLVICLIILATMQSIAVEVEPKISIEDYSWPEVWQKLRSPVDYSEARNTLFSGLALSLALVATREDTVDPLQESMSNKKPLGEWAEVGDISGQLVPNVLYSAGMYLHYKKTNTNRSKYRSLYMLESSLYSGLTTTILKVLVNERRPDGSDTKSYPSGHTTTAFAFATAVMLEHEWYFSAPAFALATLVGASRINDNRHYLHDVVAGATIGSVYALSLAKINSSQKPSQNEVRYHVIPSISGSSYMLSLLFY